jgi:hypothetical protein
VNTWLVVLTSSAVGVLASSVVTLLAQHLERSARRDELILTKSLEIAAHRSDLAVEVAKGTTLAVSLLDEVITAETYYTWLKSLLDTGKLPPDADKGRRK